MSRWWREWWPLLGAAALLGATFLFVIVPTGSPR